MKNLKKYSFISYILNRYISICDKKNNMRAERNKLFPGKMKWMDLCNSRYISRKPIYDFLLSHIDLIKGEVLDFGCGSMEYRNMLSTAQKYVGLDIEGAEKNGFIGNGQVVYYDGVHIPFGNDTFDSVISIEVFEHVECLEEILEELNRVTKMKGLMVFTVPMNFPLHLEPYDFRRFTKYGIKQMLFNSGFEVLEIKGSTTFKNTLRRLQVEAGDKKGYMFKIKLIINNLCFFVSNSVSDNEKYPIDWLVVCRKKYSLHKCGKE